MRIVKIVVIGNQGSGKTALVNAAVGQSFTEEYQHTHGLDLHRIDSEKNKLQMHIRNGEIRSLNKSQPDGISSDTKAVMICVDLSQEFDSAALKEQIDILKQQDITDITLIGTKSDLKPNDTTLKNLPEFASNNQCSYQITSAKDNSGDIKKFFTDKLDTYAKRLAPSQNQYNQNTKNIDYSITLPELVEDDPKNKKLRKTLAELGKDLNQGHPNRAKEIYNFTETFINNAKNDEGLEDSCKNYLNDCKNSKYSSMTLDKLVKAVVVAAVFAFVAASIAVGICATLGLGTIAIAGAGAAAVGVGAGSISFFKKNNVENVANAAKEALKDDKTNSFVKP